MTDYPDYPSTRGVIGEFTLTDTPHPTPQGRAHLLPSPDGGTIILRVPENTWPLQNDRIVKIGSVPDEHLAHETKYFVDKLPRALIHRTQTKSDEILFLETHPDRLDPAQWIEWFGELLHTIFRLHGRGFVHGAITPDCIWFEEKTWKLGFPLTDLATPIQNWRFPDRYLSFVAPENRDGAPFTAASDIFGIAASALYAALEPADVLETLRHTRTFTEWKAGLKSRGFSPALADLMAAMLVKDPAKRLRSGFDILNRFEAIPASERVLERVKTDDSPKTVSRDERIPCQLPARVWEVDEQTGATGLSATVVNISRGGMLLSFDDDDVSLPVGMRLKIHVVAPNGEDIPMAAYIRWSGRTSGSSHVGVLFEQAAHIESAEKIIQLIHP